MNQSVVCAIDSSQVSRSAARVAAEFARELGRELVLIHVAEDPPVFPYHDSWLHELRRRDVIENASEMLEGVAATRSGVVAETRVLLGDPVEALATAAREEAELLVVGSRGRRPLAAAMLGSVSTRLASAAECPVVVVPSVEAGDRFLARAPGSQLVCGLDDSIGSRRALRLAAGLAEHMDFELLPVHIDADGTGRDAPRGASAPGLRVFGGDPVEGLRERALEADASAIVVGSRGRGTWRAAALGSVSSALAATAPVPVVVVPPTAHLARFAETVEQATAPDLLQRGQYSTADRTQDALVNGHTRLRAAVEEHTAGRFSEGIEQLAETPSKLRRGRFSDGIEDLPATPDKLRRGRFSEGIEELPEATATVRRGSFADGYDDIPAPRRNPA